MWHTSLLATRLLGALPVFAFGVAGGWRAAVGEGGRVVAGGVPEEGRVVPGGTDSANAVKT